MLFNYGFGNDGSDGSDRSDGSDGSRRLSGVDVSSTSSGVRG